VNHQSPTSVSCPLAKTNNHHHERRCRCGEEGEGGGADPALPPLRSGRDGGGAAGDGHAEPDLLHAAEEGHLHGREGPRRPRRRRRRRRRVQPAAGRAVLLLRRRSPAQQGPRVVRLLLRPGAGLRRARGGRRRAAGVRHLQARPPRVTVDGGLRYVRRVLQARRRGCGQRPRRRAHRRRDRLPLRVQPVQALRQGQ
jgi:hypothetical protein